MRRVLSLVLLASLCAPAAAHATSPSGVVVSHVRLRTSASPYDEYVEVKNVTAATVDVSGFQLQDCYVSGGAAKVGADGAPLPAGTRIPAGGTFVFGKDAGDYTGTADATYTFQIAETGGARLLDKAGVVQDGVGAPGTPCAEGRGLTFPTSGADFTFTRTQDTDDNAADFSGPSGQAGGTACGAACAAPPAPQPIHAIQGSASSSPLAGQKVSITGVVVGVDNQQGVSNYVNLDPRQAGIYVEAPTAQQDGDPATSEGIFVGGLSGAARYATHIGQTVTVSGTVTELYGLTTLQSDGTPPVYTGTADPRNLPAPVTIDPQKAAAQSESADGTRSYDESLEGMRVRLAVGTADSGGTDKFGELFLRPGTTRARVFRDASLPHGPADLLDVTQEAGSQDVDPLNPSATPPSSTRVDADLFSRVRNVIGPLGFDFDQYGIVPQPGVAPKVGPSPIAYPPAVPEPDARHIRVANFNVENLFGAGMTDDGHTFTQAEVDAKTTKIADAIGHVLHKPDIVTDEEVASPDAFQEVADKLGDYTSIWVASNDQRHIAVGFLVKKGVKVLDVQQLGKDATTSATGCEDNDPSGHQLFERPPLRIDVKKGAFSATLIGNHWASQGHPEQCRIDQGAFVASQAAPLIKQGTKVIVLGDLNDFEDSPALTGPLVQDAPLQNLWSAAPAQDRYSFQYDGQLQTLDHIFVDPSLRPTVTDMRYVHFDNDYFERDTDKTAPGVSDHDAALATFKLPS